MAKSCFVQWTAGGEEHGFFASMENRPEYRCRAFILEEFDMLTTGAKNATRRERREFRRQPNHTNITKVEVGFIPEGSKGADREVLRSWTV